MNYKKVENLLKEKQFTWFVTGVAGFIGSHLVERLLKLEQKVIGIDNLSTGFKKNIEALEYLPQFKKLFTFIQSDISDESFYRDQIKTVDFVLHQAALGSVPRSIQEPESFHQSNVNGFFHILNVLRPMSVKKIVFASSSSVYGDSPNLPKSEDMVGNPLSPYAATKMINEIYASSFATAYGTPIVGLRYFNVFGKRQDPNGPYAAVIPLWIRLMLEGKEISINGDGLYSRDFCYIENVIQANLSAAFSKPSAHGQVFNIAVGKSTTLLELYEIMKKEVEEIFGKKVLPPIFCDFRKGDIPHSLASIEKAMGILEYKPEVDVCQGLHETIKTTVF